MRAPLVKWEKDSKGRWVRVLQNEEIKKKTLELKKMEAEFLSIDSNQKIYQDQIDHLIEENSLINDKLSDKIAQDRQEFNDYKSKINTYFLIGFCLIIALAIWAHFTYQKYNQKLENFELFSKSIHSSWDKIDDNTSRRIDLLEKAIGYLKLEIESYINLKK